MLKTKLDENTEHNILADELTGYVLFSCELLTKSNANFFHILKRGNYLKQKISSRSLVFHILLSYSHYGCMNLNIFAQ